MSTKIKPRLAIVVPCYNESDIFPLCLKELKAKLKNLISENLIDNDSFILFVDDGSSDNTWKLIKEESGKNHVKGIKLSRNRGHQIALLAGLKEAIKNSDVTISIDADLQDDVKCIKDMLIAYGRGNEIVYGVRDSRKEDSYFKRASAELFYKIMSFMGVEQIFNHADYRLLSKKALEALLQYNEQSPYLRGLVPLVGFPFSCVYYSRSKRMAGESKYTLRKMLSLALTGVTSLTVFPLRLIATLGFFFSLFAFFTAIYVLYLKFQGATIAGWTSMILMFLFFGGVQMLSIGILGEYIGKIYIEVKQRPKYFIEEKTKNKIK